MIELQVNFLWRRHNHWQLWWMNDEWNLWVSLPAEALWTCMPFSLSSFPASVAWRWSLQILGLPLVHTGHVEYQITFCFLIPCGFWELFVTTAYPILPSLTESNYTILADCRSLVIFLISRELKCQSWEMPSHLEYPNIAKEEALYFYICYG